VPKTHFPSPTTTSLTYLPAPPQVLFSLADSHKAVETAVVTMQLEVAERITAKPSTKQYGIPSVVFQLYGAPKINFKIPPRCATCAVAPYVPVVVLSFTRRYHLSPLSFPLPPAVRSTACFSPSPTWTPRC
jgi:16S rRNA (adenine1518-N6/adenine1519-N6)-dimethyltransferase